MLKWTLVCVSIKRIVLTLHYFHSKFNNASQSDIHFIAEKLFVN
jgi:hypothetical protein